MKKNYKAIKLMLEWGAYPLWTNEKGFYCDIDPSAINISKGLTDKINELNDFYQNSFINTKYEFGFKGWSEDEDTWFEQTKMKILKKLKEELPNTKIYYSENGKEIEYELL
jgi:hypothetical protein